MAYCRFENTLKALQECLDYLISDDQEELSREEREAKDKLIDLCIEIADMFGEPEIY